MANSVDPNETADYDPSHQDLHCLQNHCFRMVKLVLLSRNFAFNSNATQFYPRKVLHLTSVTSHLKTKNRTQR